MVIRACKYLILIYNIFCLDSNLASVNHPIHIIDKYYQKNPSAFIPFCEFGGNMSIMGALRLQS